jgi:ribokinase
LSVLLVFGSINVDLLFEVEALPRPGETVLCPGYALAPGGKGANQATAAARAGAAVRMVGHVGDDSFGTLARRAMAAAGVDCAGVATSGKATGIAVIGVDRAAENQIIVASGANLDSSAEQVADADLSPGVTLLCQNEVRPEATFALLERARARGARTVLNLAPAGALAIGPDAGYRFAALAVEAVDTTGAGDAFAGVLAAALDQGLSLPAALARGSVAAGLACTRIGAQASQPTAAEIEARLGELPAPEPLDGSKAR